MLAPWKKSCDKLRQHIKKQRYHFADKRPSSQSYGFSSSHIWMWVLDHKEGWALKIWCLQTVVLEKTPESPLDCKEFKPVNPKGNQPRIFTGGLALKLKLQYFCTWCKGQLFGKDPDAGEDWGQEVKGVTGWSGWIASLTQWTWVKPTQGDSEGQGSLACCSLWGRRVGHDLATE